MTTNHNAPVHPLKEFAADLIWATGKLLHRIGDSMWDWSSSMLPCQCDDDEGNGRGGGGDDDPPPAPDDDPSGQYREPTDAELSALLGPPGPTALFSNVHPIGPARD